MATSEGASSEGTEDSGTEGGQVAAGMEEFCAAAEEMNQVEALPTAEQMQRYRDAAPPELEQPLSIIIPRLTEAGDNMAAAINALADDEVEAAQQKLSEVEQRECGISSDDEEGLPAGASTEIEADATRVDVTATEYAFQLTPPTSAGRTSFVLKNNGNEAHIAVILKLAEGATLDQALGSEDGEGVDGEWGTNLAASGEEEAVSFDLEPGNYGIVCYLPSADGTPHFALGMAQEFTVQ